MRRLGVLGLILILLMAGVWGCAARPEGDRSARDEAPPQASPDYGYDSDDSSRTGSDPGKELSAERKIIYTATLHLEVHDIREAIDEVSALTQEMGGFLAESSIHGREVGTRRGYLVIRIPQEKLDESLKALYEMGEVTYDDKSTQDVTEEYIDVQARVRNLERQEERLLDLLERADTVQEVLEVERELARIRYEVESLQGRLNYLTDRVDLATINLHLVEVKKLAGVSPQGWKDLWDRSVQALLGSINRLVDESANLVVWFFGALPMLLVSLIILVLLIMILKRWINRGTTPKPPFRNNASSSTD